MGGQEECEGRRSGRAGGVGGQDEWEGRRSGRAGGVGGQVEWEGRRNGKAGGMGEKEERKAELTKLAKLRELTNAATTLGHV